MRDVMEAAENLTLVQTESSLMVTSDTGQTRTLQLDGTSVTENLGGREIETTTTWDGEKIVSEMRPDQGPTILNTYELSPEGHELFVTSDIATPRGTVTIRRVYDRSDV